MNGAGSAAESGHAFADDDCDGARTRSEIATDALVEAIVTGRLAPGTKLRLKELSRELDMSAMPVREAIRQLVALGLAEHSPRRGAQVVELSIEDLRDIYAVRLQLETQAIRLAAQRFTPADAREAAAALAEHVAAYEAGEVARARRAHTAFHFTIYEASGSRWLPRLLRPLWASAERYRLSSLAERGSLEARRQEHERILDACVARNAEQAARELHQHLALTANLVAQQMGEPPQF